MVSLAFILLIDTFGMRIHTAVMFVVCAVTTLECGYILVLFYNHPRV